ncbi:hypothetical protein FS837_010660, partial [Tulasnella sp. UAMH 9824]
MPWRPRIQGSSTFKEPTNKRDLRSVQQIPTLEFFGVSCHFKKRSQRSMQMDSRKICEFHMKTTLPLEAQVVSLPTPRTMWPRG